MRFRILMMLLVGMFANFADATEREQCRAGSAEDRLACLTRTHCPVVISEAERSQCYRDIVLTLLNSEPARPEPSPTSPTATTVTASVAAASAVAENAVEDSTDEVVTGSDPESEFGYEKRQIQQPQEVVDEIRSRIVFLDKLARGNYLIGLENGQLWQQIAKSRTHLKQGQSVRITRGSLRSYRLIPEKSTPTNVSRVVCHGVHASSLCAAFEQAETAPASVSPGAS